MATTRLPYDAACTPLEYELALHAPYVTRILKRKLCLHCGKKWGPMGCPTRTQVAKILWAIADPFRVVATYTAGLFVTEDWALLQEETPRQDLPRRAVNEFMWRQSVVFPLVGAHPNKVTSRRAHTDRVRPERSHIAWAICRSVRAV